MKMNHSFCRNIALPATGRAKFHRPCRSGIIAKPVRAREFHWHPDRSAAATDSARQPVWARFFLRLFLPAFALRLLKTNV